MGAGLSAATLSRYMSSISSLHRSADHLSPVPAGVRAASRDGNRAKSTQKFTSADQKELLLHCIRAMLSCPCEGISIERPDPVGWRYQLHVSRDIPNRRNRALLGVGLETGFSRDQLIALEWSDFHFVGGATEAMRYTVFGAKADTATPSLTRRTSEDLMAWREISKCSSGPIFRRLHRQYQHSQSAWIVGTGLTAQSVALAYRDLLGETHRQGLLGEIAEADYMKVCAALTPKAVARLARDGGWAWYKRRNTRR